MDSSYTYIVLVYTIRMFGMSMVMMPIMTNGLNQLPTRLNPHGTAVNNTAQQIMGSIGTAIFVTIMTKQATSEGGKLVQELKETDPALLQDPATQVLLRKEALLHGIQVSFLVAMFVTLVPLVLSLFLKRVNVNKEALEKLEKQ